MIQYELNQERLEELFRIYREVCKVELPTPNIDDVYAALDEESIYRCKTPGSEANFCIKREQQVLKFDYDYDDVLLEKDRGGEEERREELLKQVNAYLLHYIID